MVFAIADLHFDSIGDKPMDIFGENWEDHENKIISNWSGLVGENDLVLLPGDISWALRPEEAFEDLKKIENLPGKKIMIKGNHDYWWDSLKKLKDFEFKTIEYLQNNSYIYDEIAIAGTRGWGDIEVTREIEKDNNIKHDEKIFNRELHRLRLSLETLKNKSYKKLIVILHYPPFNVSLEPNEFGEVLKEFDVDICLYGHLHGDGHKFIKEGLIDGIEYHCVASDFINFSPKEILESGGNYESNSD